MKSKAINVDCIEGLRGIGSKSVSCVVTSPPYNIGTKYSEHQDSRDDYLEWLGNTFDEIMRTLKDDGHFFLQAGGTATKPLVPFDVLQQAMASKFFLQNQIIWVKSIAIEDITRGHFKPINSARFLNHTYEFIFHLTKTNSVPIARLAIGVPFMHNSNESRWGHRNKVRCRGNVWFIPYETVQSRAERFCHPASFPIALPKMCIQLSGIDKGSLVVDPFVGAGATLMACEELGMIGLGFDIDNHYVDAANMRLKMLA